MRTRLPAVLFSVLVVSCTEQPTPASTPAPASASSARAARNTLTRVESPSHVCMVNDRHMGSEQIPVLVDGKTYYGCCAGCKDKLQNQAATRTAVDPVSGKSVDKAAAVIARTDTGKVFYFESVETLARFQL